MRSIVWIEFLISFAIFLIIFYILLRNLYFISAGLSSDFSYLNNFQKYLLTSYYYLETKNISIVNNLASIYNERIVEYTFPRVLFLENNNVSCKNCIYFSYNYSDNSINISQRSLYNYKSSLTFYIVSLGNVKNQTFNSTLDCNSYLPLGGNIVYFCSLENL
jgi:hypothetical protein